MTEETPMLLILAAFALASLLMPTLVRLLGSRAFYIAAAMAAIAIAAAVTRTPDVLAGRVPFESFDWIPALGISLSMRMDTLAWVMTLIVTGVGALVLLYCRWYFRDKPERSEER